MRSRQPEEDPRRKVRHREMARGIVAKDRHNRKYGMAVDTAGSIARALERAYRQGFTDAQSAPQSKPAESETLRGALEWALIPPRPRSAFWSICLFFLGRQDMPKRSGRLVQTITKRGTLGWQLLAIEFENWEKVIGEKTIVPLVRLALLDIRHHQAGPELHISERGKATWQLFLERGGRFPDDLTAI